MKSRIPAVLIFFAACEFGVDIGSRDAGPRTVPNETEKFCAESASFIPFEVRLDAMPLTDPTCWNDGIVPPNHTLPEETFEVLLAEGTSSASPDITLGLDGLRPQKLGDAPLINIPAAMQGFEFRRDEIRRISTPSFEQRSTRMHFHFDRLDLAQTAGELELSSTWSCGTDVAGCQASTDRQSCFVRRPLVARQLSEVPERWRTPTTELLPNSVPHLVAIDLGALSGRAMTCSLQSTAPVFTSTPGLRALEVWQISPTQVRMPPRSIAFPSAPTLQLASDFGESPQLHGVETIVSADVVERRSSSATLSGRQCGLSGGIDAGLVLRSAQLVLESRYECSGEGCASVMSPDRGTCRVVVPWLAMRLP